MGDELDEFLQSFRDKIGSQSYQKMATILRENDFTSRLLLELLDSDMFAISTSQLCCFYITSIGNALPRLLNEFISVLQYFGSVLQYFSSVLRCFIQQHANLALQIPRNIPNLVM